MSSDNHISESEFLLEFFGNFGREFGDPDQHFVDNPTLIFQFIKDCEAAKKPAFLSVQPRWEHKKVVGIEKLFFDFDYADKTIIKKLEKSCPNVVARNWILGMRKRGLQKEVLNFLYYLIHVRTPPLQPMVVKTRKGYHVYIYFDKVYEIDGPEDFVKEVYTTLTDQMKGSYESRYEDMKYSDPSVREDICRMARIPLSIHEASGQRCVFKTLKVTRDVQPKLSFVDEKIYGLGHYKNYSLKEEDLIKAIKITRLRIDAKQRMREKAKEEHNQNWEVKNGFIGKIRPCFQKALRSGEMDHSQRLALVNEAWYSGIKTFEGLVEVFRPLHDFDGDKTSGSICRYQCQWYLDHEGYKVPPYTCKKMQELNWCIESDCDTFRRRKEKDLNSKDGV